MKRIQLSIISLCTLVLINCKSSKNTSTSTSTTSATPSSTTKVETKPLMLLAKPADGIYAPGEEEVLAIQPYDKEISLDKLNKGYSLYAQSACLQCHQAKNIYKIDSKKWKDILDDMALKANISNEQKDAVYKYVVSVKAVRLNSSK